MTALRVQPPPEAERAGDRPPHQERRHPRRESDFWRYLEEEERRTDAHLSTE